MSKIVSHIIIVVAQFSFALGIAVPPNPSLDQKLVLAFFAAKQVNQDSSAEAKPEQWKLIV